MKTATAAKPANKRKTASKNSGGLVVLDIPSGMELVATYHHRGNLEAFRESSAKTLAAMKVDKRKGDVTKFLREFRDNPRGG